MPDPKIRNRQRRLRLRPLPLPSQPPQLGDTKPATTPSDNEPVKIVARQLQVWRQSGANGFASGKFMGTSVTATGELRLAPRLRRLATTNETYIWSVVTDNDGNVYAGTGTSGKILKVDAGGNVKTFAQLSIVSVQSLLMAHDGTLWAGSSVKGQLFHVKQDGTVHSGRHPAGKIYTRACRRQRGQCVRRAGRWRQHLQSACRYSKRRTP